MTDQVFTITSTYDPACGTLMCGATSVKVNQSNTGKITVNLQVTEGGTGKIAFQDNPVTWSDKPPASFHVQCKEDGQILIIAPNGNSSKVDESYSFEINYTYTPLSGDPVSATADPTIILEGTGSSW
jgi:PKD repeat protein